MNTIYIIDLEAIESRYTCQWKEGLPVYLTNEIKNYKIVNISGTSKNNTTTKGAFLDFAFTNIYKNEQGIIIANLFKDNKIYDGDKFLFTDAWNPIILEVKYMAELLDKDIEISGLWHAGSYDPYDFLGRKIKDKSWVRATEEAIHHALDYNYFATNFHIELFKKSINTDDSKLIRSGQPHNVLVEELSKPQWQNVTKKDTILFPHRIAPEKNIDIFRQLAKRLPQYEFIVCQENKLTKDEYHQMLAESKMVFSANLQETLGIGAMEAILVNSIPFMPDRLSYSEMYADAFKYDPMLAPDISVTPFDNGMLETLADLIVERMENYEDYLESIAIQRERLLQDYLYPHKMAELLNK